MNCRDIGVSVTSGLAAGLALRAAKEENGYTPREEKGMRKADETWYRKLRWEHKKRKDDGTYAEKLGTKCANCGSEEQVVYHI